MWALKYRRLKDLLSSTMREGGGGNMKQGVKKNEEEERKINKFKQTLMTITSAYTVLRPLMRYCS
jgi:hypothetical protein